MKSSDPAKQVLLPVIMSVRADTADLLFEMASDMDISLDEIISSLAEESVEGLSSQGRFLKDIVIPDSFTLDQLHRYMS